MSDQQDDKICLPLISKESYSKLVSDAKLDILFDILIILAKNVQTVHNTVAAQKKSNTTFAGLMGMVGGAGFWIVKYIFKF